MKLLNSAMMPQPGLYHCQAITHDEFIKILINHHANNDLENFIGYQQNIDLIAEWTGVRLIPSRAQTQLNNHDSMLVMKLKYRPIDPATKGQPVNEQSFEYFLIKYNK